MHLTKAQWGLWSRIDLPWVTMKLQCRSLSPEQNGLHISIAMQSLFLRVLLWMIQSVWYLMEVYRCAAPNLTPSRIMDLSMCLAHIGRPAHILRCITVEVGNLVRDGFKEKIGSYIPETDKYYKKRNNVPCRFGFPPVSGYAADLKALHLNRPCVTIWLH